MSHVEYEQTLSSIIKKYPDEADDLLSSHRKIMEVLDNSGIAEVIKCLKIMAEASTPIRKMMEPLLAIKTTIDEYFSERKKLSEKMHVFPADGWYLSLLMIDQLGARGLNEALDENTDIADSILEQTIMELVEERLDGIEEDLLASHAKRANIIREIFALHLEGRYFASIPMALAQADGMCKDFFFTRTKDGTKRSIGFFDIGQKQGMKRPQAISKSLEPEPDSVLNILSSQLAKEDRNAHPLMEYRTTKLSDLNRHAIMHGESVDYASKVNSAKSILLLDFVNELCMWQKMLMEQSKQEL
jgi:hypothetical protein